MHSLRPRNCRHESAIMSRESYSKKITHLLRPAADHSKLVSKVIPPPHSLSTTCSAESYNGLRTPILRF